MKRNIWSDEQFLKILSSELWKLLIKKEEITFLKERLNNTQLAALLHANGITDKTNYNEAEDILCLVMAFMKKDAGRMKELLYREVKPVSAGVRLDYLLPLATEDSKMPGGEDIFVAAVKRLAGGNREEKAKLLNTKTVRHCNDNSFYSEQKLNDLNDYIDNSFKIRELLQNAPNKVLTQPTKEAVEYIVHNATTYIDSNKNPVIVFIPGAIGIKGYTTSKLIEDALDKGVSIDAVGFFGSPGICWSIIMGDVKAVNTFIEKGANLNFLKDEFSNSALTWACCVASIVEQENNIPYLKRMNLIIKMLDKDELKNAKNCFNLRPYDYLEANSICRPSEGNSLKTIVHSQLISNIGSPLHQASENSIVKDSELKMQHKN